MTLVASVLAIVLAAAPAALVQSSRPAPEVPSPEPDRELVLEGEIETYIAIGGESTGWRLRSRTAEGRRKFVEVLLTAEVAQGVRANTRVRVRGTMQTRRYPERGEVQVLVATEVIEVARR